MKTAVLPNKFADMPKTYDALERVVKPRPLHNEAEYDNAIAMIDRLAGYDLNPEQDEYLDVLTKFVGDYEDKHHKIDTSDITPIQALKFLLDENGLSGSDLGRLLGSRTLGPAILNGERQLSKTHIRILADFFRVDASLFIQPEHPAIEKIENKRLKKEIRDFLYKERNEDNTGILDRATGLAKKLRDVIAKSKNKEEKNALEQLYYYFILLIRGVSENRITR